MTLKEVREFINNKGLKVQVLKFARRGINDCKIYRLKFVGYNKKTYTMIAGLKELKEHFE